MVFLAIAVWGHARVLFKVLAEERGVGEVHGLGNLLDAVCGVAQAALYLLYGHHFNNVCGGAAKGVANKCGKVLGCDVQAVCIVFNETIAPTVFVDHPDELLHQSVAVYA